MSQKKFDNEEMAKPLVSVLMATFNGAQFLQEQVESILSQTYSPIEFIVFDDCSTDDTLRILEEYQNQGKLRIFRNPSNLGYVRNFERAIQEAKGELIALADQDDIWAVTKLERMTKEIGESLLIHSDARLIDDKGAEIAPSFEESAFKMTIPQSMTEAVLNGFVTGCTCLFKRQLLEIALPFPDQLYIHDKWLGVLAYSKGGLKYLKDPLTDYRQHNQNNIGALQSTVSPLKKLEKLLQGKAVNYQIDAFRSFLLKEQQFAELVCERLNLESKEMSGLLDFFNQVLSGKSIFRVVFFWFKNFGAFEKGKSLSQKVYFLYLILLCFFYSRGLTKNRISISIPQ